MIPYFSPGPWSLGPLTIHMFGVLVGLAIILGVTLTQRDADKRGLNQIHVSEMLIWVLVGGFVMAHLVSVIFYFPERIKEDPLELIYIWKGLSSFGGYIGGILGAVLYLRSKKLPAWPYIDATGYGLSFAWILGRAGCTTAHDHPGKITDFLFSVQYPAYQSGSTPEAMIPVQGVFQFSDPILNQAVPFVSRHDLGLYEMVFAMVLSTVLFLTNRHAKRFAGFNVAMLAMLYAPVRFGFDYLRVADAKYLGFTPGQYFSVGIFGLGLYIFITRRRAAAAEAAAPAAAPAPEAKPAPVSKKRR